AGSTLAVRILRHSVSGRSFSFQSTQKSSPEKRACLMKGQKFGRPRGKTCRWTPELDGILKTAWVRGGLKGAWKAIHEYQPTWSIYSIRKRAAALSLRRPRASSWTQADIDHMLWAIDSNASLTLIAGRLGRSVGAVRHKLRALGYSVESLGGYK